MRHTDILEAIARVGYGARGVVYLIVGGMAVLAAVGIGAARGSKGALQLLLEQPLGHVLLGGVAVGLAAFAVWRGIQALADPDGHGSEPKGLVKRARHGISAAAYVGLAAFALSLLFGGSSGDEDRVARDWTAWLLAKPFGQWLVAAIGAGIIVAGVATALNGSKTRFLKRLDVEGRRRAWVVAVGQVGLLARGFAFLLVGTFLITAAMHAAPDEARGLGGALQALQAESLGGVLLGLAGVGLVAFGFYGFAEALYRRVEPPTLPSAAASMPFAGIRLA